jgi:hypothetical protein
MAKAALINIQNQTSTSPHSAFNRKKQLFGKMFILFTFVKANLFQVYCIKKNAIKLLSAVILKN